MVLVGKVLVIQAINLLYIHPGVLVRPGGTGAAFNPTACSLSKSILGCGWMGLNTVLSGAHAVCSGTNAWNAGP